MIFFCCQGNPSAENLSIGTKCVEEYGKTQCRTGLQYPFCAEINESVFFLFTVFIRAFNTALFPIFF